MLRMDENPAPRFPEDSPLEDDLGRWSVAYVKSRQDKALAHELADMGISYYLPLVEKRVRRRDNKKIRKTRVPLFPGYIALVAEPENRDAIYKTRRLCRIIDITDQEQFVNELNRVRQALESKLVVRLLTTFQPGQQVRVKAGPLMGAEGTVIRARGKTEFVIKVQMFNQSVAVEMDEVYLEAY